MRSGEGAVVGWARLGLAGETLPSLCPLALRGHGPGCQLAKEPLSPMAPISLSWHGSWGQRKSAVALQAGPSFP